MGNSFRLPPADEMRKRKQRMINEPVQLLCQCTTPLPDKVMQKYWECALEAWDVIYAELEANGKRKSQQKLGMVLDIDDTVLWCACPVCLSEDRRIKTWRPLPIKPLVELYKVAKSAGVLICLVSARRDSQRKVTEAQLKAAGMGSYTELVLVSREAVALGILESRAGVEEFKIAAREHFSNRHKVRIIATIGDQLWDVAGPDHVTGYRGLVRELPQAVASAMGDPLKLAAINLNMPCCNNDPNLHANHQGDDEDNEQLDPHSLVPAPVMNRAGSIGGTSAASVDGHSTSLGDDSVGARTVSGSE